SSEHLLEAVGGLSDPLLRALVWGALWDGVREGRIGSEAFVESLLEAIPGESDAQVASFLLRRATLALRAYLPRPADGVHPLQVEFEALLVRGMNEPAASYDLRKGRLDALLTIGVSETALRSMEEMLSGERQFNGAPLP